MIKPIILLLIALAAAASVQGCSKQEPSPTIAPTPTQNGSAPDTKYAPLMKAVFGADYREANGSAIATLPDPDNKGDEALFVVEATSSIVLTSGETVLVTNSVPADEEGNPSVDHASPGGLSVYVLQQTNSEWRVIGRYEHLDALGSSGNSGTAKWVQLGADKTGLVMLHGGTWMGYTIQLLSVYSVAANKVERLTGEQGISMESDSDGACTPDIECWDIHGDWQFIDGKAGAPFYDLLIAFSGEKSAPTTGSEEKTAPANTAKAAEDMRESTPTSGAAVYRFQDGEYKLLSGENIVPSI